MMTLCGFAVSNYYNKVKLALLEKGLPFDEFEVFPNPTPELLAKSPLGKIPYLETDDGVLVESQVLMNYIESRHPAPALVPADPFAAARVHELVTFLDVHLELVARELFGVAFFGGRLGEEQQVRIGKQLKKNIAAFGRLAKFAPYVAGEEFSMADCAAIFHFPVISLVTKTVYG
jgi:glutathione S-transferase